MPPGVEHMLDATHAAVSTTLISAPMPPGVEHYTSHSSCRQCPTLISAPMPPGVEHRYVFEEPNTGCC